eukprot:9170032-Pyramimonas_sp.AAC.2
MPAAPGSSPFAGASQPTEGQTRDGSPVHSVPTKLFSLRSERPNGWLQRGRVYANPALSTDWGALMLRQSYR